MPQKEIESLNELSFACEMRETCKSAFLRIMDKMDVPADPKIVVLPCGGIRILCTAKDMDINAFWDADTRVMKMFVPDLAEQLETVRQMRELCIIAGQQKNMALSFSGIGIADIPVLKDALLDYCAFTGRKTDLPQEWRANVDFGMEMTYERNPKAGTPFKVFSSCQPFFVRDVMDSLKKLMSAGMDKNTAEKLREEFGKLLFPAKTYLAGGDAPKNMEEFETSMRESLASTWFISDIRQEMEERQETMPFGLSPA